MLKRLYIRNYVLIEELEITPFKGLNIITGETGAGKSILLGAAGLLMGERAEAKVMFNEGEKCVVEGEFDISGYGLESIFDVHEMEYSADTVIRREVSPGGKSRAFINDSPVTLEVLRTVSERLLDIHSQHQTLLLANPEFQVDIVDAVAGTSQQVQEFGTLYKSWNQQKRAYDILVADADRLRKESDYTRFLVNELREAKLFEGEQLQLEEEKTRLENISDILEKLQLADNLLSSSELSALISLKETNTALLSLSKFSESYKVLADRVNSCTLELKDIAREIEKNLELTEADPARLLEITNRLDIIYTLLRKHHLQDDTGLIVLLKDLEDDLARTGQVDEDLEKQKLAIDTLYNTLLEKGKKISSARKNVFSQIESEIKQTLSQLGIPDATLNIALESSEPTKTGLDKINFLFSANKGIPPQELKKAASGGEFSRLMFAVKFLVAGKTALPTIVFDEIDTGVSGEVALKLGRMLERMGENLQVLTITHLPQVASKGKSHYFVYKDNSSQRTTSKIRLLDEKERLHQLAQMIGGENYSATATQSAKELLHGN
jgi:DNA repair protein RecN (Recombination protein N)